MPCSRTCERLPVHHLGHAIGDGGDAVVKIDLPRGNVDGFELLRGGSGSHPEPSASRHRQQQEYKRRSAGHEKPGGV